MKAKITAGKIRFLMLCLTVLFSVMGISFSASAEGCTHPNLSDKNWEVVREADCQQGGLKTQWCHDCGKEVSVASDPDLNAHVKGKWTVVTPHSCQNEGYEVIYCAYGCRYLTTGPNGEAAGDLIVLDKRTTPAHDYKVIYKEEATCQKDGYEFIACVTCYDSKTSTIPKDPNVHAYTPEYTKEEATCSKPGKKAKKCLQCGFEYIYETEVAKEHNEDSIEWDESKKVPATCEAPGYIPGVCGDCGNTVEKVIPKHAESSYVVLNTVASTCSTKGVEKRSCVCGFEYEAELPIDADAHVYGEWHIKKEPSCTAGSRYKFCEYHYEAQIEETIPSNGIHNYGDWEEVAAPTCSSTGLEKRTCLDCEEDAEGHVETRTVPTKHEYGTWITEVNMSCDERELRNGKKLAKCDNCSYEKYFTIPAVHSFSEWRVIAKADCKTGKPGTMDRICTDCGKTETKEYYLEHDFTDWYVTGKPQCADEDITGKSGRYTRWCNNCKVTEHKSIGVNHEFVEAEIIRYPVCNKDGSTVNGSMLMKCKFCDVTKTAAIPAEHNFGEWSVLEESTCTKAGEKEHTCISCGYTAKEEIPAAHNYGYWLYDGKKVECGKEFNSAVTLRRYCKVCNTEDSVTKTVTKIDHPNKLTVEYEATCSSTGYTMEMCPDCGDETRVGKIIPAKGHNLDEEWSSKDPATCNSEGSRYKACSDCDYLEYEKVARTEHMLVQIMAGKKPTCTEGGYTDEAYCSVCRKEFESYELEPLEHSYDETGLCTVCKMYKGAGCVCDCHSSTGMQKIIFNIINKLNQMFGLNQKCKCGVFHYEEPGFFAKLFGRTGVQE